MSDPAGNRAPNQNELVEMIDKLSKFLDPCLLQFGHLMSKDGYRDAVEAWQEACEVVDIARGYKNAD